MFKKWTCSKALCGRKYSFSFLQQENMYIIINNTWGNWKKSQNVFHFCSLLSIIKWCEQNVNCWIIYKHFLYIALLNNIWTTQNLWCKQEGSYHFLFRVENLMPKKVNQLATSLEELQYSAFLPQYHTPKYRNILFHEIKGP